MLDLIVIGGGPAGYLAAERAARAGLSVLLYEARALGGVCLNEGCVPSKALLQSAKIYESALHAAPFGVEVAGVALNHAQAVRRRGKVVERLVGGVAAQLKAAGVEVVMESATVVGRVSGGFKVRSESGEREASRLLIATGSSPVIPPIPGLEGALASGFAITSREALTLAKVPERLVVVGGGAIGLEMAAYYNTAGSDVTVVELLPSIAGAADREVAELLRREYERRGVKFLLGARVARFGEGSVCAALEDGEVELPADKVLLSVGRRANAAGFGLESIGAEVGRAGVVSDEYGRTSVEGVYVAGDANGRHMLAHTAYREAEAAVNAMLGRRDPVRYHANPSVIYAKPEVACVGHTEESAREAGIPYEAQRLPASYSGRFVAETEGENGLCKILVHKTHRNVIGAHLICPYASEIIWGAAALIETELRVRDARELIRETLWKFGD